MKKIGIDARFLGPKGKGLGRYAQKLVEHLERVDGNSERTYYIFLKKNNFHCYNPSAKNFKKVLADYRWYSFGEQLFFPFFLKRFKLDLMHFCHFNIPLLYRKKFIVTIHDLILFHYPTVKNTTLNKYYYFIKLLCYRLVIKSAARRACKIIAVSEYTKQDILSNLNSNEEKTKMIYEGCEFHCHVSYKNADVILKKYGIIKPYLLHVGNAYPHKNLERLLLAFKQIRKKKPELSLVLAGGNDYFFKQLIEYSKKHKVRNVVFPGYVPDEEMDVLYRNAKLYVFPSLYEGFGLPPLEALAKYTPVASSSSTSLPEILGDLATYFEPDNKKAIAEGILEALKDCSVDKRAAEERLRKFDWRDMAEQTKELYEAELS